MSAAKANVPRPSGGPIPTFNRAEAEDFLALRWNAAQNERPVVFQDQQGASTASPAPTPKKTAWADAAKSGNNAPTGFAAKLVKAAGDRRGGTS